MSKIFKWHMFITSFLPLWLSIIILNIGKTVTIGINNWNKEISFFKNLGKICLDNIIGLVFAFVILAIAIWSTITIIRFIKKQNKNIEITSRYIIKDIKPCSNLTAEYIIAYILPMLVFDFNSLLYIILFLLYFCILAFVSIRNNHVYTNLLFELKGYRIFKATVIRKIINKEFVYNDCIVLSKENIGSASGEEFPCYDFQNSIFLNLKQETTK